MQLLFILNDSPYSSDKSYNGLRTALHIQKENPDVIILMFLMGDGVGCAISGQKPTAVNYNMGSLIEELLAKNGKVKICKSCMDARGFPESSLIKGTEVSNMSEYSNWIINSDKIINF
jgi:uncharacterized protein involved in oxidation of intracellular sulfur